MAAPVDFTWRRARIALALCACLAALAALALAVRSGAPEEVLAAPGADGPWRVALTDPDTPFMAEMTSGEIAARMEQGARTVIVPVGGLEQNGPHVVTGKHNLIVREGARRLAAALGHALVAETVAYVPQGALDGSSGWIGFPGAVGVSETTYRAMLRDMARSLAASGFAEILYIADSGGDLAGLRAVAAELDPQWRRYGVRVHFLESFYWDKARLDGALGLAPAPGGAVHSHAAIEAQLAWIDPAAIRAEARLAEGWIDAPGASFASLAEAQALGEAVLSARITDALNELASARATGVARPWTSSYP